MVKRYDAPILGVRLSVSLRRKLVKRAKEDKVSESEIARQFIKDGLNGTWNLCFKCRKELKR